MTWVCVSLRQWLMSLGLLEHIKTRLHSVSSALLPSKLEWGARFLCSSHVSLQQIPFSLLTPICVMLQHLARRQENGIPACARSRHTASCRVSALTSLSPGLVYSIEILLLKSSHYTLPWFITVKLIIIVLSFSIINLWRLILSGASDWLTWFQLLIFISIKLFTVLTWKVLLLPLGLNLISSCGFPGKAL